MIKLTEDVNGHSKPVTRAGVKPRHAIKTASRIADERRVCSELYSWCELKDQFEHLRGHERDDKVFLYRHGATNYNRRNLVTGQHDVHLSEDGRHQARALCKSLPEHIDLIATSGLSRAIETMALAVPLWIRAHAPVLIDPRLNEVHLGVLQGRRRRHIPEFEAGDLDFAPPQGESYRQAAQRVFSSVVDILSTLADCGSVPRVAAVFCHAGVLRIIATLASSSGDPKEVFRTSFGNTECLELSSNRISLAKYWGEFDGISL